MSFLFNSKHSQNDKSATQKALTREAEHAFESMKLKLFEKLDVIKQICIKAVIDSAKENNKTLDPLALNTEALGKFEKVVAREIEKLRFDLINAGRPFAPFISNTLDVPANIGFNYGANIYNAKHNMIICSPSNSSVHFYEADDLTPMKQRKKKQLNSSVVQMSYCEETDTHLMGCAFGDIYTYNATLNKFKKILKEGDSFILAITHLDENNFAFSSSKSGKLFFGNLKSEKAFQKYSKDSDAWYLHHMPTKNLLLAGLANGKIAIYRSKGKDGRYPMLDSLQAHKFGKYVTMITSVNLKGKEYIVTGGNDHTIKIWHTLRGKLKLLKVIQNNEDVSTIVYLENYQMIASTHHKDYIKFFKMPHGKLEATVNLGLTKARNIFLMKDKNTLGVADLTRNVIKMVQLHPAENSRED